MFQFSLNQQFEELVKVVLTEEEVLDSSNNNNNNDVDTNKMTYEEEPSKSHDFFQDNNAIKKKRTVKKYRITRIKSGNFLSNISYVRINKENFYNEYFAFDIYALMTKNLNPFSLDRKG